MRFLLVGLLNTLKVSAVAMAGALVFGALLALGRLSRRWPLRLLASAYIEFFRGIPLYLLILFCGFGLPQLGYDITLFTALALGLTLYNSAILAEIYRAGILSLDRGQSEAAYGLGMTYSQAMRLVIVPQAIRRMVPAIVSQLVTLIKDSSLGVVIGYEELLRRSEITGEFFGNTLQALAVAAVFYIIINFSLSQVARRLEVRQRRRYNAGAMDVTGVEDLAVVERHGHRRLVPSRPTPASEAGAGRAALVDHAASAGRRRRRRRRHRCRRRGSRGRRPGGRRGRPSPSSSASAGPAAASGAR